MQEPGLNHGLTLRRVDHQNPTPKYLQAREILIGAIRAGTLPPGTKLPSTKEIGSLVDISLITAHKALEGLVETGWLRREVGRGTYVREDVDPRNGVQRQLFIGLILDRHVNIDDYYHSTIINALRRAAWADARRVEFFFHDRCDLRDRRRKDVGAICVHPVLEMQGQVEELAQRCPVVVLGGTLPTSRVVCVDCDNTSGARAAVRHLLELGHRRFMLLSGPLSLSNARDRVVGATAELAKDGITLEPQELQVSRDSVILDDDTKVRLERRLTGPDRPTAILAGGFYLALAAMQTARQAGLVIPEDVSIIGFDDPPSASLLDPPLTTVRQPLNEMAAQAYSLTRRSIVDRQLDGRACLLPTELTVRGSTGPAPC